ncbi:MAG: hypothetical protein RHS_3802 [Robinsoniella sp. RHS]|nr:MAG: hypothetical protein RHS_3802 [Robinsoniella sp. RHS]
MYSITANRFAGSFKGICAAAILELLTAGQVKEKWQYPYSIA